MVYILYCHEEFSLLHTPKLPKYVPLVRLFIHQSW